jgi:hypothetical protein
VDISAPAFHRIAAHAEGQTGKYELLRVEPPSMLMYKYDAEALVASCDVLSTASERWSSVGSIGVCVETSASSDSDIMTTGYYRGETCNGTSAQGFYVGSAVHGPPLSPSVSGVESTNLSISAADPTLDSDAKLIP